MSDVLDYLRMVLVLCRKELLALFKDPANRTILFAPALMQGLLFGYAATYDLNRVPYALLDQSRGGVSHELVARLEGGGVFHRVATLTSGDQIASMVDSGKALIVLTIPADFEDRLAKGQDGPVQVVLDGRNSTTAALATSQVGAVVEAYNQTRQGGAPALRIERRAWYNPNLESRWNIMPALIATLTLLQTLLLSALSVAREREQGTFDQLLVTPMSSSQILIGKAVPSIVVGLAQSTIILCINLFWFRIPLHGSLALIYLGLAMFTLAAVGVGLSISALSQTMQQAMLYTFMIIMPLVLLSGLMTPVKNMPEILQWATMINPLRFGVDLVRRVYLEGAGFREVASDFVPLLAVAAVTLPLSAWLFRNKLS